MSSSMALANQVDMAQSVAYVQGLCALAANVADKTDMRQTQHCTLAPCIYS